MGISRKLKILIGIILIGIVAFTKFGAKNSLAFLNGKEVIVVDNGFEFKIKALGDSSEEILKNAGVLLNEKDLVYPLQPEEGGRIIISRAIPVNLSFLGKKEKLFTREKTVEGFLIENNIEIKKDYILNYNLGDKIFPEMEIKISKKAEQPVINSYQVVKKKISPPIVQNISNSQKVGNSSFSKTGEVQIGLASWYSYIPGNYCASLSFPRGAKLLVTNLANGRSVVVTVNDRGPYIGGRVIDLERNAFSQIGGLSSGVIRVKVERIY